MRIRYLLWIFLLIACKKDQAKITPTDVLIQEHKDGKDQCPGTFTYSKIIYNASHFDSVLIQYPCNYDSTRHYPLMIYFHGLLNAPRPFYQLQSLVQLLMFENFRVPYSFITIVPKDDDGARSPENIDHVINYAIKNWPVDTSRIYLTGASIGASNVLNYLIANKTYDSRIAAGVVMIPIHLNSAGTTALTNVKTPLNFYTGDEDADARWCKKAVDNITANGGTAEIHTYHAGHCCTTDRYRITDSLSNGKNIYDWMIQYHK